MSRRQRRALVTLCAAGALAVAVAVARRDDASPAFATPPRAKAERHVASAEAHAIQESPDQVATYWTPERIRAAQPARWPRQR